MFRRLVRAVTDGAHCALPAWPLPDTLKYVNADGTAHRRREGYVVAQSPMAFSTAMLRRVFGAVNEESIAVEQLGGGVVTVPGDLHKLPP
jgi:2-C-methyl-D-erythritol 4-phosphate cytidylyltransferase